MTLYELLARRPAFDESEPEQLIRAITDRRLKSLASVRADIPLDLSTIVDKATHPDAELRYQSAADLRDDLQRYLADEPIKARRVSLWGRFIRWVRRNRKLATAIGLAAFALLAATIVSTVAYTITSAANQRTNDALEQSEQTVDLALNSLDDIVDVISQTSRTGQLMTGDAFEVDDLLPDIGMEPSPVGARILDQIQPIYERLSNESPTRPDIILQSIDAGIQLARIQHTLGQTSKSIDTLNSSLALLMERSKTASVAQDSLQLQLARLNNELGSMHAADFNQADSRNCYETAVAAAQLIKPESIAGKIELARAHLNLATRTEQRHREESMKPDKRRADLKSVDAAIQILEQLDLAGYKSRSTSILYARSLFARSRLTPQRGKRRVDLQAAIGILRDQLNATPDDTSVRFELVATLTNVNLRGRHPDSWLAEVDDRLSMALDEIKTLRTGMPDNAVYLTAEIHIRHKLSAVARMQSRYKDAAKMIGESIRLQTLLMETQPDSLRHTSWRALLYRSQAMLYRSWHRPEAAREAIEKAQADVRTIEAMSPDHPLVTRTQQAIQELSENGGRGQRDDL